MIATNQNNKLSQGAHAPVMSCRDMSARYGRISVVSDVNIDLFSGEMLGILGPNGAGKSSLLGAISGIVSGGGEVMVDNRNLSRMSADKRASNGIAFVPEQRGNIFATMSVEENLNLGLSLLPSEERDTQRNFICELFPILQKRADAMAGVLSGGEQQMLAIGMALGRKPKVLLLDEPSQGLAPVILFTLRDVFSVLRQNGLGLVMAEQNVPFAAKTVDRYIVLSHGHIVRSGEQDDLANPEQMAEAFMGTSDH